jgi:hypothetical protein
LKNAKGWGAPGADKAAKARASKDWGACADAGLLPVVRPLGNGTGEGAKAKEGGADMPR